MIKLENTEVVGWEHAIRGMRNPKNSHSRMDSGFGCRIDRTTDHIVEDYEDGHVTLCKECGWYEPLCDYIDPHDPKRQYIIGPNDHKLMMNLASGGPVHAKYRRMIAVYVDITAPLYWWAEMDTYKVGTVRNSCSFMHKGLSKPFEITDFSVKDERVYEILSPKQRKTYELSYPYETDEYKIYTHYDGKTYKVYRNGYVIREAFEYTDSYGAGRTRKFDDKEATIYQTQHGYFAIKFSGRNSGHMLLHRLVATMWCEKPEGAVQVNHKDGNKGNNCAENLEWITASENMQHAVENHLCDELGGIRKHYKIWKTCSNVIPVEDRFRFKLDCAEGLTNKQLADKWNITYNQASNLRHLMKTSEYEDLFYDCYIWENLVEHLNYLRSLYIETKDDVVFQNIRCLLPQGYLQKSTMMFNYEILHNIYVSRKDHRLDEWREFCRFIEELPYSEIITGKVEKNNG